MNPLLILPEARNGISLGLFKKRGLNAVLLFASLLAIFLFSNSAAMANDNKAIAGIGAGSNHMAAIEAADCTFVVATDGKDENPGTPSNPFRTIQKSADVAQPGDIICVREGIYSESTSHFRNSGTSAQPVTLINYPGERPILEGGAALEDWLLYAGNTYYTEDFDHSFYVIMVSEDEQMLMYDHSSSPDTMIAGSMIKEGNRIYVFPYSGSVSEHTYVLNYLPTAIRFESDSYIIIDGLTFKNYNDNTIVGDSASHHINIQNCVFKNNVRTSLTFSGDYITVDNCDISWSGVFAIHFTGKHSIARNCTADYISNAFYASHGAEDILFENCEASHFARRGIPNTAFHTDGDGVGIGVSNGVVVRNCYFHDSGNDFIISAPDDQKGYAFDVWKADQFTIEKNILHSVDSAIHIAPGSNGLIANNLIYDTEGAAAIGFYGSNENPGYAMRVYGNTIYNCSNDGIAIKPQTSDVTIKNNLVANCGGYEYHIYADNGHIEDHNLFYDVNTANVISWLGSPLSLADYQASVGQGLNSLSQDPLLLKPDIGDFHLQPGSPAIDAGEELAELATDIEETSRPQGMAFDIGAYETHVSTSFIDVPADHWAYIYIEVLYQARYTAGCCVNPPMYCPEQILTREEAAVFTVRGVHGVDFAPLQPTIQIFDDVPLSRWSVDWITQLWEDDYTAGCGTDPLIYCPARDNSLAEGCVFFLRMMYGSDYIPPDTVGIFADAPAGEWYTRWVEAAYNAGLIEPCQTIPELLICPNEPLSRAKAAYMMCQAKDLPLP